MRVRVVTEEKRVLYRESCDTDLDLCYEQQCQNMALKQPTRLGPWLVMSLGTTLIGFLVYLVYSNLHAPIPPQPLPEQALHSSTDTATLTGVPYADALSPLQLRLPGAAITAVPHSRSANALLGGQGPALLPGSGTVAPREVLGVPLSMAVVPR
jgi:hypothetical protein